MMSEVIDLELVALLARGVCLWDVVAEAHCPGKLDSRIRSRNDNDLCALLACHPNIKAIAFNGGTAAKLGMKVRGSHVAIYQIQELPLNSPAYTLADAEKAVWWQAFVLFLVGDRAAHRVASERCEIE